MKNINWQTRDDGVIYFDSKGFEGSYYIYPANYDDNKDVELNIMNSNGQVLSAKNFTSIEDAQIFAMANFKDIIKPYVDIV